MEDAADLGLSIFEKGIDKYHDKAYDGVTHTTQKVRGKKHRKYTEEPLENGGVRTTAEETTHYYPPEENDYRDTNPQRNPDRPRSGQQRYYPESQYTQPASYQPGTYQPYQNTHSSREMAEKDNYEDTYSQRGGYRQDSYDPNVGSARGVGRDGYAANPEDYDSRSGYDDEYRRGSTKSRGPRYLEYAPDGSRYGSGSDQRHKSYDDLRGSRGGGYDDGYSSYDDEEDERDRRAVERRDRRRSQSKSRSGGNKSLSAFQKPGNDEDNPKWQEWGATVAGAAVGAYGVHRGMGRHSNGKGYGGGQEWLPAVVGAVVGGLVARGAEKEWKKRSERGRELDERLEKVSYRSKSR